MPRKRITERVFTSETMAYLHCWRKADEQGFFFIPCKDKGEAERMKFMLYSAAKQLVSKPEYRAEYPKLVQARENCSLRSAELTPALMKEHNLEIDTAEFTYLVTVYRSDKRREVQSLVNRLGLTDEDLRPPKSLTDLTAEQALQDKLHGRATPKPAGHMMAMQDSLTACPPANASVCTDSADALLADLLNQRPE